jgi:hypothetical protein
MSELSAREDPKIQFCQPCWQLAYSKTAGFDPNFNLANRMWYWRGDRSAFGRFENDVDGLFSCAAIHLPRDCNRAAAVNDHVTAIQSWRTVLSVTRM